MQDLVIPLLGPCYSPARGHSRDGRDRKQEPPARDPGARLLAKLDALGLTENTWVFFLSDHGFYFGEHGYFGKAEWVHDPGAAVAEGSVVPEWLPECWLLTVGWSPLYKELTNVPLMVRGPGLAPGRRQAITTAPDLAPTILELTRLCPRL
ncbi:MAG: sulfatase-like hydrolase/transferase [Actinomycetota bacterium]|nr:sulfatase-like hydrolase/transferase [Actinomycetota bacterium]